ncbi:MAG: sugar transferase [Actinomycetota bacterium]|nr:sugar transferase [Actinomycetota bacterium]
MTIKKPDADLTSPSSLGEDNTRQPRRSRRIRALVYADFLVLVTVLFASVLIRFGTDWPKSFSTYLIGFLIASGLHMLVYYFGELYDAAPRIGAKLWLPRVTALTSIAILLEATIVLITDYYLMPRGNLLLLWGFGSLGITFNRWLSGRIRVGRYGTPRVLLVGSYSDIKLGKEHIKECGSKLLVVGEINSIDELSHEIESKQATDVLLLTSGLLSKIYPKPLEDLEMRRVGVFQQILPSDTLLGLRRSIQIAGMPFTALRAHTLSTSRSHFKTFTEYLYLVVLLIPILILTLFTATYVRIVAGKGIILKQERVGKFGSTFNMLKFRTMYHNAEDQTGIVKAQKDDHRIITGLKWVRRSRLDELPQFINVLKGEMSIIGPRPERPDFTNEYEGLIPGYGRRHDIPPGITGLAQVSGHYHTDPSYKLGHDLQYLVNWSPILDLQILIRTVWVIFIGRT